jgi:cysteinyl-tRNA synthetase
MAMQYLGESFDLHGGGEDLIFPHHECEIAQAEAATGKVFARYWMHNGLVNMGKEKMSKSLGNTLAIRELVRRHDPQALRLYLLGIHYRNPLEWSESRAEESARALERFTRLRHDAESLRGAARPTDGLDPELAAYRPRFEAAMDDDFNTPQALGVLFDMARALAERRDAGRREPGGFVAGVAELTSLAGSLGLLVHLEPPSGPPGEVQRLVAERAEARKRRDWRRSDEIRDRLSDLGWTVEDTPAGPRVFQGTTR